MPVSGDMKQDSSPGVFGGRHPVRHLNSIVRNAGNGIVEIVPKAVVAKRSTSSLRPRERPKKQL
jgi:hypothetical protein